MRLMVAGFSAAHQERIRSQMKNDRFGLLMIAASLMAITLIGGLLYQYQLRLHDEKIRQNGVTLTRALANADIAQLAPESAGSSLMARLINVQASENFAYGLLVDPAGKRLYETTLAANIAPATVMPTEPFGWYGDQNIVAVSDGRKIREFFAPVMRDGVLAGFVRIGYFAKPANFIGSEISNLGLMALPVFLLTAFSYFLIRRELKPLQQLNDKVEQASLAYGARAASLATSGGDLGGFMQRFDQFMQLVQSRVQQRDMESVSAQTASRMISYRQEKAESALNAIPEAVLVIDDACVPSFANSKAEALFGTGRDEIVGRPVHEWCQQPQVQAFLMRYGNAPSATGYASMEYAPEDNPARRIAVSAFPLFSPRDRDTLFGRLIVFRDVSEEYLARQAGVEFVAHVSHELKTPLNTLSAYSELLLDYAALAESERVTAVNVIHGEVERMTGLINNLLNISKLENGTMQLARTRVKMHDLLQDSFETMLSHALGKGIQLNINIPPDLGSVKLDKNLFRIAIDNLLSNAIKYSNAGGNIMLSAQLLDDSNQIQVSVRDQGIGIAAEDREKIFDKYFRAANRETAARSGHGLGLYLVKQIVDLHQGTIAVKSEPGKGSEFTVTFKAQPVNLEESQPS